MKRIFQLIIAAMACQMMQAQVGQWNAFLAYHDITDIEPAGNMVYVLSSNDLFSYNYADRSVTAYNKMNYLNDTDISYIAWCNSAKRLVIVYSNYNIDLLDNNGNVISVSEYLNTSLAADKTINSITINGNNAYICTGFGVMKLNVKNAEISDTYNLGKSIQRCTVYNGAIYVLTANQQYKGNLEDNLSDPASWTLSGDYVPFDDDNLTYDTTHGYTRRIAYDEHNKCYWCNQEDGKLMAYTGEDNVILRDICPEGPKINDFNFMTFQNGTLYTCGSLDNKASIQTLTNDTWTIYEDETIPQKTGQLYYHMNGLAIDPKDKNHVYGASSNGLYEFQNGEFVQFYNSDNSIIESYNNRSRNTQLITNDIFDQQGNLWMLNSEAPTRSIIELTAAGEMVAHDKQELMLLNSPTTPTIKNKSLPSMQSMFFDRQGYLWFCVNSWWTPSVHRFDTRTDDIISFSTFNNQDGTRFKVSYGIRCVTEDRDGNIWIGTSDGPLVLEPDQVESSNPVFTQVKVPRNDGTNYADYLLADVDITCMLVDGSNQKWFGTGGNGLYVFAADNITQMHHFTTENSDLLSDDILSLAVDNTTGEVFVGTDKGLCSYQSGITQTTDEMVKDNVYAYPNPVRPDYTGLINIVGLTYNADVKIVTSNGVLVAEGRSNGGSFTWDGCDRKGRRVASGVYMVQTATSDGKKGTVCKIAIIN